jgi:hypothetical protein
VTKEAGLLRDKPRWGSGCTFIDYDRNGLLDLFVGSYLDFDFKTALGPGASSYCNWKGIPVFCGPRGLPPGVGALFGDRQGGKVRKGPPYCDPSRMIRIRLPGAICEGASALAFPTLANSSSARWVAPVF